MATHSSPFIPKCVNDCPCYVKRFIRGAFINQFINHWSIFSPVHCYIVGGMVSDTDSWLARAPQEQVVANFWNKWGVIECFSSFAEYYSSYESISNSFGHPRIITNL